MARARKAGFVVARDAIVVNVGARPIEYRRITVMNRRTGQRVEINDTDSYPEDPRTGLPPNILDPGDEGVPYAFKSFQRVSKDHPAVKACPDAFMPLEEVDEDLVVVA
jgi:hypothetical protein